LHLGLPCAPSTLAKLPCLSFPASSSGFFVLMVLPPHPCDSFIIDSTPPYPYEESLCKASPPLDDRPYTSPILILLNIHLHYSPQALPQVLVPAKREYHPRPNDLQTLVPPIITALIQFTETDQHCTFCHLSSRRSSLPIDLDSFTTLEVERVL